MRIPKGRDGLRAPQAQRAREEGSKSQRKREEQPGCREQVLRALGGDAVVPERGDGALDDCGERDGGAEGGDADDAAEEVVKVAG